MPKVTQIAIDQPSIKYREEWLSEGLILLEKKLFVPCKYRLSKNIQVSCGFPSSRAFAARRQTIGECWYPQGSDTHQLFISPVLHDPVTVLGTLVHEVVHTVAGSKAAHGSQFKYIATRVGLTGKMTATVPSSKLIPLLESIGKELGEYPHKPLDKQLRTVKRGPSRVSCECMTCGYAATVSLRWVEEAGYPLCPTCTAELSPRLNLTG